MTEVKEIIEHIFVDSQDDTWRKATNMVRESVEGTFSRIHTCNIGTVGELKHAIYTDIQNMVASFFKDKEYDKPLVKSISKIAIEINDVLLQYQLRYFGWR
ncbi:hypothetical protein D1872_37130 [compost metagenome]